MVVVKTHDSPSGGHALGCVVVFAFIAMVAVLLALLWTALQGMKPQPERRVPSPPTAEATADVSP